MQTTHRSLLRAEIVVETTGSEADHKRVTRYVADTTLSAAKSLRGGAVLVKVTNEETGAHYGFSVHGDEISEVSQENLDILFRPYEDTDTKE